MGILTGTYKTKLDDKGRLSLPARLRNQISQEQVVVLPGIDGKYLIVVTPEYFTTEIQAKIASTPMAMLDETKRLFNRKFIATADFVDIDASGRINIPLQKREQFGLKNRGDALILGALDYIEIWSQEEYDKMISETESVTLSSLAQALSDKG